MHQRVFLSAKTAKRDSVCGNSLRRLLTCSRAIIKQTFLGDNVRILADTGGKKGQWNGRGRYSKLDRRNLSGRVQYRVTTPDGAVDAQTTHEACGILRHPSTITGHGTIHGTQFYTDKRFPVAWSELGGPWSEFLICFSFFLNVPHIHKRPPLHQ